MARGFLRIIRAICVMAFLRNLWLLLNLLAIDVALAAMGGMYFFASLLELNVPSLVYLGLGAVVWTIYNIDHLLDARMARKGTPEPRRDFHSRHFKRIRFALLLCAIGAVLLIWKVPELRSFLPVSAVLGVIVIGVGIVGRYGGILGTFTKEVLIALVYVAGVSIFPIWQKGLDAIPLFLFIYLFGFFLLAWINLWILSYWDRASDLRHGFLSIATVMKPANLQRAIVVLGILINLLFFGLMIFQPSFYHMYALIILLISHIHMVIFLSSKKETQHKRQILEASFLITWLLMLVAR